MYLFEQDRFQVFFLSLINHPTCLVVVEKIFENDTTVNDDDDYSLTQQFTRARILVKNVYLLYLSSVNDVFRRQGSETISA